MCKKGYKKKVIVVFCISNFNALKSNTVLYIVVQIVGYLSSLLIL